MEITDVRIAPREEDRLRAFVTLTFDDCFVVRGVKIIRGQNGRSVVMPNRRKPDGQYQDVAHPIHREMRQRLEDRVLDEYDRGRAAEGAPAGREIALPAG